MLLKARAEMLGKEPLRKAPPHDALFSHVWNNLIKFDQEAFMEQQLANQKQQETQQRQQQVQQRTQSSPAPADPFGQMNEGASLDGPTQGMGANFRQGRQETRDPNRTGMMGRAKQGIGNFMNRFRRQPSQRTESTPPSLQEEQAPPADERAFRDTPRAELPPSFQSWNRYDRNKDPFPTRDWVRDTMDAGGNDLAEWDRMNTLREQREAEAQQTQQAEQGNDFRAATRAKMAPSAWPSPMQEAQEMKTPVDAGLDAMREPAVPDDFYDRMTEQREPRFDKPTSKVEEQQEFVDPFGQMNGLDEREELPPDFNTEIEPQYSPAEHRGGKAIPSYVKHPGNKNKHVVQPMEEYAEENPDWMKGMNEEEYGDWAQSMRNQYGGEERQEVPDADFEVEEQEERLTNPLPTGGKGVKGLLPDRSPRPVGEDRMLPESTGENKPGEMAGPPSKARTGFNEVNNRSEDDKTKQDPRARGKNNRLMEKPRREKMRNEKYNVMPEEQQEKAPPKKAAPKKAKKSPAAKAVKATASKRKAKAKPLEATEEMREEAPKKGATKVEATTSKAKPKKGAAKVKETTSKKAPKMEIGEGAERIEAKPKKGASKVKETTSKAKPKKGSALATVNEVAEQRKKGADPSKNIFADKAKPARTRTKNPKKTAVKGMGEAAARSRTRQAAKAKKNEPSEESAPQKEYGLSISGSASPDEISEIMEAARSGNKSAQSAIYNNAGTLEDEHGISADDIQEASGR